MLLGLAFGHHNVKTSTFNNKENVDLTTQTITVSGISPGGSVYPDGPGNGGATTGDTGQTPPPFINP